jgi:hypothetical protein
MGLRTRGCVVRIRTVDIAWFAGIYEGEGCATCSAGKPRVQIAMTDRDIILRCQEVFNLGTVLGPHETAHKPRWIWGVSSGTATAQILFTIWPFLGERRREQALLAIDAWKAQQVTPLTHCRRGGHEYTPENTYIAPDGGRHCRMCDSQRNRERYALRCENQGSTG